MDFIPRPPGAVIEPIDVPLLATIIPYDDQDLGNFEKFPKRHGFLLDNGRFDPEKSIEEYASLLQSWLYFGLIAEFVGHLVNHLDFLNLKELPSGQIMEILSAVAPLETILRLVKLKPQKKRKELWLLLKTAGEQSQMIDLVLLGHSESPLSKVVLSTKVLIVALSHYAFPGEYHPNLDTPPLNTKLEKDNLPPAATLLKLRMERAGWCSSQVRDLCYTQNYAVLYYLSQLHRRAQKNITHEACTWTKCIGNNVDLGGYPVAHLCQQSNCDFIAVDEDQVCQIIRDRGVPLVSIERNSDGRIRLEVQRMKATSSYVAISHVWSGGMGNSKANSLPTCVLERLGKRLEDLPVSPRENPAQWLTGITAMTTFALRRSGFRMQKKKPQLFWLDTLCIPVNVEHEDLRLKAINMMALIYATAAQVLVLDSELQQLHVGGSQDLQIDNSQEPEVLGHLLCCAWQTRCWTLQEGALGRCRRFQFADAAIELDAPKWSRRELFYGRLNFRLLIKILPGIIRDVCKEQYRVDFRNKYHVRRDKGLAKATQAMIISELRWSYQKPYANYWDTEARNIIGQATSTAIYDQFVLIWNALAARTTTQRNDLCLILCSLLDFNSYSLNDLESYDEKMKRILLSVGPKLPLSLLYNTGDKIKHDTDHSNRWIPSVPSADPLTTKPSVEVFETKLLLTSERALKTSTFLIHIKEPLPHNHEVPCLVIKESVTGKAYRVQFIRKDKDSMQNALGAAACILVEGYEYKDYTPNGVEGRGAYLHVTKYREGDGAATQSDMRDALFRAKYDCPLRIWPCDEGDDLNEQLPIVIGEIVSGSWNLEIEADLKTTNKPLHRRPIQPSAAPYQSYANFLAFYLSFLTAYHILPTLYQLHLLTSTWPSLPPLTRARYLIWLLSYTPPLLSIVDYIHMPLASWLIISAWLPILSNNFTPFAFAYFIFLQSPVVYYSLALLVYPVLALFYVVVLPYAHAAWVDSFEEGWRPGGGSYRLFWGMKRVVGGFVGLVGGFLDRVGGSGERVSVNRRVTRRLGDGWRMLWRRRRRGGVGVVPERDIELEV